MYDLSAGFDILYRSFQGYLSEDRYDDDFYDNIDDDDDGDFMMILMMMMMIVMSAGVCVGR